MKYNFERSIADESKKKRNRKSVRKEERLLSESDKGAL